MDQPSEKMGYNIHIISSGNNFKFRKGWKRNILCGSKRIQVFFYYNKKKIFYVLASTVGWISSVGKGALVYIFESVSINFKLE